MTTEQKPLYIKVHPTDNVAIIVNSNGLPAGAQFSDGLTLVEHVPQGHKVALTDIAKDEAVVRYGEIIGYAAQDLPRGSWIDEFKVVLPKAPPLDTLPLATRPAPEYQPLEGFTFEGYRNKDGSVGTKNLLGITTSVHCVAGVVDYVVKLIERDLLPKYPNVDGVVGLNHLYGCGVAINAPAAVVPIRTIHNIALNPNFGGEIMVIGLGCEKLQPTRLLEQAEGTIPIKADGGSTSITSITSLQDEQFVGFKAMVDSIMATAEQHLQKLNARQRETCPASDLVVGMQCGGSDAFSGVTANPAVGFASDLLVRCGATVMFSEVTEVRDAIHLLTPRAVDRSANPSPGNKKGGLANVVEKALGSIAKSGTSAIVEVLSPGQRPTKKGLIFAATPASDFVCGTQQLASGITVQVFTTGRGTPYGLAALPVIKVATRTDLANRWFDLMDIDAGKIATGDATIEDIGWEIFRYILDVASGKKVTWSDQWGLHNALSVFNPAPVT